MNRDIAEGSRMPSRGYPPTVGPSLRRTIGRPFGGTSTVPTATGALSIRSRMGSKATPSNRYPARSLCTETNQFSLRKRARACSDKFSHSGPRQRRRTGSSSKRSRTTPERNERKFPPTVHVFATQICSRRNDTAKTGPRVDACAAKPTGSGKSSPHRKVSPNPGSKPAKSNFLTGLGAKVPPTRAFGFHLCSGDSQLGRAQDSESGSSEKKLEDRRSFLIPNQEIRLASGVGVHRASRWNPKSLPSASSQVLNRGASPGSQNLENRNGTHLAISFQVRQVADGPKYHAITLSKRKASLLPASRAFET